MLLAEVESRTQGLRSRTQKKLEAKAKNMTLSRPRTKDTGASVLQKNKKRFSKIFFKQSQKKGLQKFFSGENGFQKGNFSLEENKKGLRNFSAWFLALSNKFSTFKKIVLYSSRRQGNFRGLEASRPRTRTSKSVLEAKDILEDSFSGCQVILIIFLYTEKNKQYALGRN